MQFFYVAKLYQIFISPKKYSQKVNPVVLSILLRLSFLVKFIYVKTNEPQPFSH